MQDTTEQKAAEVTANTEIDAIYENGVFRPLTTVGDSVEDGQYVKLVLQPLSAGEASLKLLANFYEGMSEEEIQEIEAIMLDRSNWSSKPLDEDAL